MPKSRFNAVREKARATRHNPVARPINSNGQEGPNGHPASTILPLKEQDAIPILKSLPLGDSKVKADTNAGDILWALISLSSLLADKSAREKLLGPGHQLVGRVTHQLHSGNDIQIRDAASGFLRNLCIEAGSKARRTMEEKGNLDVILMEITATAEDLSFMRSATGKSDGNGGLVVPDEADEKRRYLKELQSKPKEQLNKKERRHLAKLESAELNGSKTDTVADMAMDIASQQPTEGQIDTARGSEDDEKVLLSYSHMKNLFSILWSLTEVSSQALDRCRRSASSLCSIIASVVTTAVEGLERLSHPPATEMNRNGVNRVDIGEKDRSAKDQASLQLALTALNALVSLTDSDAEFAAAFVGYSRQQLRAATKESTKGFVLDEAEEIGLSRSDGSRNIQSILASIYIFERLGLNDTKGASRDLVRIAISIALLSAAVVRNVQSCLPKGLSNAIRPEKGSFETLGDVEMVKVLPFLNEVLSLSTGYNTNTLLSSLVPQAGRLEADHILTHKEKAADEDLNNILLCLEVLAELVSDSEGWSQQDRKGKRIEEDSIEVDDDGDADMIEDDDASSEEDTEDITIDEDMIADKDGSDVSFATMRVAQFFSSRQIDCLLALSLEQRGGFADAGRGLNASDGTMAGSLRSITIRALSVLNNQTLALASFAHPPPSQPNQHGEVASRNFQEWLTFSDNARVLGKMWRRTFEYASRIASLPFINETDPAHSMAQDARKVLQLSLCIMWSLSRCFEGVDGTKCGDILAVEATHFAHDEYCHISRHSYGVIASLIAAYKSSKRAADSSVLPSLDSNQLTIALQEGPTPDGIRIHSLGVLSTLVRQSFVNLADKEQIINLLLDTLEVLPTRSDVASRLPALGLQDVTSIDAMVVAINGIIDTFADEKSEWDHLYSKLRLQSRLKRSSIDVKSSSRTIDKRKQPSLRAAAEESWRNLIAFIEYRDSLVTSSN